MTGKDLSRRGEIGFVVNAPVSGECVSAATMAYASRLLGLPGVSQRRRSPRAQSAARVPRNSGLIFL